MLRSVPAIRSMDRPICHVSTILLSAVCTSAFIAGPTFAQTNLSEESTDIAEGLLPIDEIEPFKQARYAGTAILIHLPTNIARALVMPEPVTLQGDPEQMPGVELAYEGEVIGFFATRTFARRPVSFIGTESGVEYRLQIRASEYGIAEPLEIVR